jgi:glucose-6-phosphate isomerase
MAVAPCGILDGLSKLRRGAKLMTDSQMAPLRYDDAAGLLQDSGINLESIRQLAPRLEQIRTEIMEQDLVLFREQGEIPVEKQPLDGGFVDLPARILSAYIADGERSELGRILGAARRLQDRVDRVVVLGIGGSYMGARALMDACCDPYFNELSRDQRGGRPRLYFAGNNVDNDAAQALLQLISGGQPAESVEQRWGIIVISKSGGTLETAVAFRQFLAALRTSLGDDASELAELVIPVTGSSGRLFDLAQSIGCTDTFEVPDGVGGRFSILSPVGLLPAAVLGLNVVRLLEGAAHMTEQFHHAPAPGNIVLDYVGTSHLWETRQGATTRVLSVWSDALESVGLWYDQLLAESLGKAEFGATPLTTVNTRDLHSRAQQHQEGRRDKLITNLIVDRVRHDPLAVGTSKMDHDCLNDLAEKNLPELMSAAIAGTNEAYFDVGRPTTNLHLPAIDEASLGQLFQMLMLATVVEGRLLGINPYGQPGVEAYKRNMNRNLGRG